MEDLAQNCPQNDSRTTGRFRRRLWVERTFFALLALGGLVYYGLTFGFSRGACVVDVDGKPAAVVANRAVASHLLEEINRGAGAAPDAAFGQEVTLHDVSAEGTKISSEADG